MATDGKKPDQPARLDDWTDAVDEWDASLELPIEGAMPSPSVLEAMREKALAAEAAKAPPREASVMEPLPWSSRPPVEPLAEEDPLLAVLNGELEMPEVPGQALGAFLNELTHAAGEWEEEARPAEASEELMVDWAGDEPEELPPLQLDPPEEPAPPAPAMELPPSDETIVLPDEIAVTDLEHIDAPETPVELVAPVESSSVDEDLDVAVEQAAADPESLEGIDLGLDPVIALPPIPDLPPSIVGLPPDEEDPFAQLELESGAVTQAVSPEMMEQLKGALDSFEDEPVTAPPEAAPSSLTDSDFYDDIVVEKEAPEEEAPQSAAPSDLDLDLDLDLGFDTGSEEAPVVAPAASASQSTRTSVVTPMPAPPEAAPPPSARQPLKTPSVVTAIPGPPVAPPTAGTSPPRPFGRPPTKTPSVMTAIPEPPGTSPLPPGATTKTSSAVTPMPTPPAAGAPPRPFDRPSGRSSSAMTPMPTAPAAGAPPRPFDRPSGRSSSAVTPMPTAPGTTKTSSVVTPMPTAPGTTKTSSAVTPMPTAPGTTKASSAVTPMPTPPAAGTPPQPFGRPSTKTPSVMKAIPAPPVGSTALGERVPTKTPSVMKAIPTPPAADSAEERVLDLVAEPEDEPAPSTLSPTSARPRRPLPAGPATARTPLVPRKPGEQRLVDQPAPAPRLPAAVSPPSIQVAPEVRRPGDASWLREEMALLESEMGLCQEPGRTAELAHAAGRVALRLGELEVAQRCFATALEVAPQDPLALRGQRRTALALRRADEAAELLSREAQGASPHEQAALLALRSELLLVAGSPAGAQEGYAQLVAGDKNSLRARTGLLDAATLGNDAAGLRGALTELLAVVGDTRCQAAWHTELGRWIEQEGDDAAARTAYQAGLAADETHLGAALGELRCLLRGSDREGVEAAQGRAARLLGGGMAAALERRNAVLALAGGAPERAIERLALAPLPEPLALALRASAEEAAGRNDAAAETLKQLAAQEAEPGQRVEALARLGEMEERLGRLAEAAQAFEQAAQAASEDAGGQAATDAVLGGAMERIGRARGDAGRLVELARAEAAQDPAAADLAQLRAARLLIEMGKGDEAAVALEAALEQNPRLSMALTELVELHVAAGRPAEAAHWLLRVADRCEDAALGLRYRERAARLLGQAGALDAALGIVPLLKEGRQGMAAVRVIERLLLSAGRSAAAAYAVEAEHAGDAERGAWLWHQCGLGPDAPDAPDGADGAGATGGADAAHLVEAQRRALELVPGYPAAVAALELQLAGSRRAELLALGQAQLAALGDRPAAVAARLRLAGMAEVGGETALALQFYGELRERIPPTSPLGLEVLQALMGVARRTGELPRAGEALEQLLARLPEGPYRTALMLRLAGWEELHLGRIENAAALYGRALEFEPDQALALPGWTRTYQILGRFDELVAGARARLERASDVASRITLYQELAHIDGALRGDAAAAEQDRLEILNLDHAHHASFRMLERTYVREERWLDLVTLYEQMGLTATDTALAVAVFLDLVRLRERLGQHDPQAIDNDYRRALYRDAHCRPALRQLLGLARERRDHALLAELLERIVEEETHPGSAAGFGTRVGEALEALGKNDVALGRYRGAAESVRHVAALRALAQRALRERAYADAVWAFETAGQVLRDAQERARCYLAAGVLAEEELNDRERAIPAYQAVLEAVPGQRDALERLQGALAHSGDWQTAARVLTERLGKETHPAEIARLHFELAVLHRDHLGRRDLALQHLQEVLARDAGHLGALGALANLHYEDGRWAEAADIFIRHARLEKDPAILKDAFFKLGLIYAERLPDAKRAVVCFTRVLQHDPENKVALERLSQLATKEGEWRGALAATSRLVELETEPAKRIMYLHRIATIQEEGLKDVRAAHEALRRAVEIDPHQLSAIGELARFYDRQGDLTSARVHLDRSAQAMRQLVGQTPEAPEPYHALFRIFNWKRAFDQTYTVAALLKAMNKADAEEETFFNRFAKKDGYPGQALADRSLDDTLFVGRIPPGFRHLFRLLDELLQRAYRTDVKRLGVGRQERLPPKGPLVRDVANRVAADLGIRDFDVYVTAAAPRILTVELTDPISLVFGQELVAGLGTEELRFCVGRCLKMVQSHMAVPLRLSGEELGVLMGGIVRQFIPEFLPRGFDAGAVAAEAARLAKVIPRKLHQELLPFALECADPALDLRALASDLIHTANRAGALCAGSGAHGLVVLRRLKDEEQVHELLRFVVSDEFAELRRTVGTAIG